MLNPNGVLFGRGAQVNVGGLVASTLNLSNDDFMAGRYRFLKDGSAGEVSNAGDIIANGGYVALIGPQVKNEVTDYRCQRQRCACRGRPGHAQFERQQTDRP